MKHNIKIAREMRKVELYVQINRIDTAGS